MFNDDISDSDYNDSFRNNKSSRERETSFR